MNAEGCAGCQAPKELGLKPLSDIPHVRELHEQLQQLADDARLRKVEAALRDALYEHRGDVAHNPCPSGDDCWVRRAEALLNEPKEGPP
ncbi:MAG TPA: hypothetical protein VMG99_09000 [Thermoplasmata archaeon]|nr:hypothetical protein [Thermoplasmata archaeon]